MITHGKGGGRTAKERAMLTAAAAGFVDVLLTTGAYLSSNSSALLADSLKTLLEFCAALVALVVVRRVSHSSSHNFNYGTGKLEGLSSLLVGILMCVCLFAIAGNAIFCLLHPSHISGAGVWAGMAIQLVYALINGWIYAANLRLSKAEGGSTLLKSQANLFLSKMLANIFIFAALASGMAFSSHAWSAYIDPLASLLVGFFILSCATGVFSNSVFDLMDRSLEESDQLLILRGLASHFDQFRVLHGIRSRRAGGKAFIEIFLEFDPAMTASYIHAIANSLKAEIEGNIPNSHVSVCLSDKPA